MSSGVFSASAYETDSGTVLPARVQPETLASFNPAPATAPEAGLGRIKLSAGRREFGISPRLVTGVWTTAPANYKAGGSVRIPILTANAYQSVALNDSLTYLGGTFRVTGKTPEKEN